MKFRYSWKKIFRFIKEPPFILLTVGGNITLLTAVLLVYFLERHHDGNITTFFDAFWWGVSTITTVGYGDIVPESKFGRIIGVVLMYTGTVIFVAFTSLFASYWVRSVVEEDIEPIERDIRFEKRATTRMEFLLKEILQRLNELEKKEKANENNNKKIEEKSSNS